MKGFYIVCNFTFIIFHFIFFYFISVRKFHKLSKLDKVRSGLLGGKKGICWCPLGRHWGSIGGGMYWTMLGHTGDGTM